MAKKEAGLSALSVVVIGGSFEQRRAVGQMVFGGLQIMSGGLFTPQINCADALKSHVTAGDIAEISGRGIDAIKLQLAAHGTMMTDSSDAIDSFKPDQGEFAQPMEIEPFKEPSVSEKLMTRALSRERLAGHGTETMFKINNREYNVDQLNELVESGNFNEDTMAAMEAVLKFANVVARIRDAIHPQKPVAEPVEILSPGHFSLSVRDDHGKDGEGNLFEPQYPNKG